jgi:CxxC motif-containing protein
MTQELTCITCPIGCRLVAERLPEGELAVSGNRCARGAAYAREELLAPKRTVTATCRAVARPIGGAAEAAVKRIPCRTTAPCPRERVDELLSAIYALEVPLPVARGRILIKDALGLGIDVMATRTLGIPQPIRDSARLSDADQARRKE